MANLATLILGSTIIAATVYTTQWDRITWRQWRWYAVASEIILFLFSIIVLAGT